MNINNIFQNKKNPKKRYSSYWRGLSLTENIHHAFADVSAQFAQFEHRFVFKTVGKLDQRYK